MAQGLLVTALAYPWPDYADSAHKLLSDNRDRYIEQSRNTRNGVVAQLPARPSSLHNRPATPPDAGAGSTYTNVPGVTGGDPFAQYDNTPVALYRDGQEYERDAMRDGAFND